MNVIEQSCFCLKKCIRRVGALICILGALGIQGTCLAEPVQFQPAQLLSADPGSYSIPCVTDWNGDGKKDLLVGYQSASKIALYLNTGTDANPVFSAFTTVKANGSDIYLPSGGCGAPAPFVCDYNNDGKRDLLVGEGASGYVYFYRNTNTDAAPILAAGVALQVGTKTLSVGIRATPYVYDWNHDGKNDLLCGTGAGTNVVFINTGTALAPAYSAGVTIKTNGVALYFGSNVTGIRSVVRMFDWDGDGLKDLMGSNDTGVYWCKNMGSAAAPLFQSVVALKAPVSSGKLSPINTAGLTSGSRMRLDLVDWNNDGVMDLLVGDYNGTISYFKGYRFLFKILGTDMCGGHILEWESAPYLKYNVFAGDTVMGITNRVATNLPSSGVVTCWTNVCGAPQQFFRLQIAE